MTYAHRQAITPQTEPPFTVVPRLDLAAHPCLQILDVVFDNATWCVINFYHDVRDNSCLWALTNLDIDAVIPTLVIGNFNAHSLSWSPLDIPRSRWSNQIEEWAATNLLILANNPGEITRQGVDHECDSVIDLAWYNEAAIQTNTFDNLQIDWEGSLGSDHALLHIEGQSHPTTDMPLENTDLGVIVDPKKKQEWIKAFTSRPPPTLLPLTPTTEEVDYAAEMLYEDIQSANCQSLCQRRPWHPKAAPWWNEECQAVVQALCDTRDSATRSAAHAQLKRTVRKAKRTWADDYIGKAKLWDVAAW
jgi:hypothetical protein